MKVQDAMTAPARSCEPGTNLVDAARTMWDHKCGALPVLEEGGAPVGVVTDRDIAMALARKNRFPADIRVQEIMSPNPVVCRPDDDIQMALETMATRQIQRLPVVNEQGRLVGILSISDVVAAATVGRATARGADAIHRMVAEALLEILRPAATKD